MAYIVIFLIEKQVDHIAFACLELAQLAGFSGFVPSRPDMRHLKQADERWPCELSYSMEEFHEIFRASKSNFSIDERLAEGGRPCRQSLHSNNSITIKQAALKKAGLY